MGYVNATISIYKKGLEMNTEEAIAKAKKFLHDFEFNEGFVTIRAKDVISDLISIIEGRTCKCPDIFKGPHQCTCCGIIPSITKEKDNGQG